MAPWGTFCIGHDNITDTLVIYSQLDLRADGFSSHLCDDVVSIRIAFNRAIENEVKKIFLPQTTTSPTRLRGGREAGTLTTLQNCQGV